MTEDADVNDLPMGPRVRSRDIPKLDEIDFNGSDDNNFDQQEPTFDE